MLLRCFTFVSLSFFNVFIWISIVYDLLMANDYFTSPHSHGLLLSLASVCARYLASRAQVHSHPVPWVERGLRREYSHFCSWHWCCWCFHLKVFVGSQRLTSAICLSFIFLVYYCLFLCGCQMCPLRACDNYCEQQRSKTAWQLDHPKSTIITASVHQKQAQQCFVGYISLKWQVVRQQHWPNLVHWSSLFLWLPASDRLGALPESLLRCLALSGLVATWQYTVYKEDGSR